VNTATHATDDDGGAPAPRLTVPVTCALLERDGRLLVAQRPAHKKLPLKWEFPGGKIEPGETGVAALTRELQEELGIEVDVGRELTAVRHDYGTVMIELRAFRCRLRVGEPHPHEHVAVRWCTPAEVAELDLAEADRPVLALYVSEVASG